MGQVGGIKLPKEVKIGVGGGFFGNFKATFTFVSVGIGGSPRGVGGGVWEGGRGGEKGGGEGGEGWGVVEGDAVGFRDCFYACFSRQFKGFFSCCCVQCCVVIVSKIETH